MNNRTGEPYAEAGSQHQRQRKLPAEAIKRHYKEQDAGQRSPHSSLGIVSHQTVISRVVGVEPYKYDQTGQRHGGNQSPRRGKPLADLGTKNNDGIADQQLDKKIHLFLPFIFIIRPKYRRSGRDAFILTHGRISYVFEMTEQKLRSILTL